MSKAKSEKERRLAKNGIKKIFKYDFFDENQFATIKDSDLKFDFSDNMSVLNDYNGIGFDFETEDLGFPMNAIATDETFNYSNKLVKALRNGAYN